MANTNALVRRFGRNLRWILTSVLLAGWTAGWGLVALVGWAAYSPGTVNFALVMMATGVLGYGGSYAIGRSRLKARAENSLISRAELADLSLSDNMAARLHLFDDAWLKMQPLLDDPQLPFAERSPEVFAELREAQSQLFQLAERETMLKREIGQLDLYTSTDLVEASRSDKRAQLDRVGEQSETLVKETRELAATAEQVQAIASTTTTDTAGRLKEAVSQFNLTLAAYREVEDEIAARALPAPQEQAAVRAQRSAGREQL